jgi:RNA methyltransferase, TrmH family
MDMITSLSNPLIKKARSLRHKKARSESGLFLVEGIHHIGEAAEAGWQIESVLYSPELLKSSFAQELLGRISSGLQPVSTHVMESLADKDNPQGILAIAHQRRTQFSDLKPIRMAAAVISPQDPGNVGTILRTLDAVGADALFALEDGVDLYHPTVVRSSMGTMFWKPIVQASFVEFVEWARKSSIHLIGTSARAKTPHHAFHPSEPWILVLGNEQKGLSAEQIAECEVTISLPMYGRVSSLNLAVAAGVLLYQFAAHKR